MQTLASHQFSAANVVAAATTASTARERAQRRERGRGVAARSFSSSSSSRRAGEEEEEAAGKKVVVKSRSDSRRAFIAMTVASTTLLSRTSPSHAIQSEIELTDLSYAPTECPPNQYLPSKKSAMCVEFTATAKAKKKVSAANVFGFIDDYDGNSAATNNETGTSRVVLAQIDRPIPEGTSEVKFVVTVFKDSYNKGKFKLKGFKAVEANAAINKRFVPLGDCDLDTAAPGCPDDPFA